jgi:hypothetical protein
MQYRLYCRPIIPLPCASHTLGSTSLQAGVGGGVREAAGQLPQVSAALWVPGKLPPAAQQRTTQGSSTHMSRHEIVHGEAIVLQHTLPMRSLQQVKAAGSLDTHTHTQMMQG